MSDQAPPVAPATAPNPAFQQPPAGPGENREKQNAASMPTMITLPVDDFNRYRGAMDQLAKFQAEQQAALEAKETERIQALAETGKIKEALEAKEKQWSEKESKAINEYKALEAQVFGEKIGAALYEATSGLNFASEQAGQMCRQLLRDQLEARRDADGSIKVYEKGGHRPAAEMLRERLSDPSLAFFFAPTTRGGSGSDGARHPAPPQQPPQPGSLQALADEFNARQGGGFGLGPIG